MISDDVSEFAVEIHESWRVATCTILSTAQLCSEADAKFRGAQRDALLRALPFGASTFSKLVTIGRNYELVSDQKMVRVLPPNYSIIYEIVKMQPELRVIAIEKRIISKDMKRNTLLAFIKAHRNANVVEIIPPSTGAKNRELVADRFPNPTQIETSASVTELDLVATEAVRVGHDALAHPTSIATKEVADGSAAVPAATNQLGKSRSVFAEIIAPHDYPPERAVELREALAELAEQFGVAVADPQKRQHDQGIMKLREMKVQRWIGKSAGSFVRLLRREAIKKRDLALVTRLYNGRYDLSANSSPVEVQRFIEDFDLHLLATVLARDAEKKFPQSGLYG